VTYSIPSRDLSSVCFYGGSKNLLALFPELAVSRDDDSGRMSIGGHVTSKCLIVNE
jgi:hypothetical protein